MIKPTRCTNFSNLFLEWKSTYFGQFLCLSSGVFRCAYSNVTRHRASQTAIEKDQDVPIWSCSQVVSKTVWHIPLLCVHWKTPDDRQRKYPKHVDFHSKNKFEKLVHLVGFIIRINLPNWWKYRALKILYPKHVTDFSKFYSFSCYFNLPGAHCVVLFSFFVPVIHCFQLSLKWRSFGRGKPEFCMFMSVLSSFHLRMESRTSTSLCSLFGEVALLPNLRIFLYFV